MILFLGAGVSKLFDVPDMMGFASIFNEDPRISESEIFKKIKETFGNGVDLEILMTVLEDLRKDKERLLMSMSPQTAAFMLKNTANSDYYLENEEVKNQSMELIKDVKDVIRRECFRPEVKCVDRILDVYDRFFNVASTYQSNVVRSGDGKITLPMDIRIFTTNYDRCIETYLGRRQVDFTQGLVQRFGYVIFDISTYDERSGKVGLFKLHGTIDLFNIDGIVRQRKFMENLGEEVVYYPIEFSGYNHVIESPYLELFYLFRNRLRGDNTWIIIGSSLRDRTICSIMNDVIRLESIDQRPRVVLVTPDINIPNRLKSWGFLHLGERIRQVAEKFGSDETNRKIIDILTTPQK